MNYLKNSLILLFFLATLIDAQHRGDNHGFQGLQPENYSGVLPVAMGGAYTAKSADINALLWNPAGLSGIQNLVVDVSYKSVNNQWRESQRYRPNRYFVTLPFYLEGWYMPSPDEMTRVLEEYNRKYSQNETIAWDWILAEDSAYVVNTEISGKDPYSKGDADWIKKRNTSGLGHIAAAYPVTLMDRQFVFAAAYSNDINVQDFDRNDTYLAPHIGYSGYDGFVDRVDGSDTLNVDWYRYLRSRSGETTTLTGAVSVQALENLNVGLSVDILSGETDDILQLNQVGHFGLFDNNEFFFLYDTLNTRLQGTSDVSATKFNLGFMYNLDNIDIGLKVQLPYTLERKWNYTRQVSDTAGTVTSNLSGTDQIDFPAVFTFGLNIRPFKQLAVSFDYEYAPYKDATFKFASSDSLNPTWVNQNILRFGLRYQLFDFLTIMAGYRYTPQVFIPDGSAITDKGPLAISYSLGASIRVMDNILLNAAYEIRELRYYDQYFSNTNYVTENNDRLIFGINYTIQ